MNLDKFISYMRKLAKGDYWQSLYANAKEINGVCLFHNQTDFTSIQVYFLNELSFFHSIYFDVAMGDVEPIVLTDEIYADAYIYYKNKNRNKEKKKIVTPDNQSSLRMSKKDKVSNIVRTSEWLMKNPKK